MNVTIEQDTSWGFVPLEVNFSGITDHSVTGWLWAFGDGDTSTEPTPSHAFDEPGVFKIELQITTIDSAYRATSLVGIAADTLIADEITGKPDSTYEITIYTALKLPTYQIVIPIEYSGDVDLEFIGYETAGCISDSIESISYPHYDGANKKFTLDLSCSKYTYLEPTSGPLIKLKFKILSADPGTTPIILDGYDDNLPLISSSAADYQPTTSAGLIEITSTGCCTGLTGDVNCAGGDEPDISDIVRLIDFLYLSKDPLCCPEEAETNGDCGTEPDISDIVRIIDYLYLETHTPCVSCDHCTR
jgi:hypothetical protein